MIRKEHGCVADGLILSLRDEFGCATVAVRRDMHAPLQQRIKAAYGIDLVPAPRRVAFGKVAFLGIGPSTWLAMQHDGDNRFAHSLKQFIGNAGSVADQTDGYIVHRMSGPQVRQVLAKGFPIDLHERAFAPGDVAVTAVSHIGAFIWRLDDSQDGAPVFEIAVARSLVDSFRRWLGHSAAEFGLAVA
jgi:sarcosine oxidase subunit gamma